MSLAVSTARADITPSDTYRLMGGYGTTIGPRQATGIYGPLTARCAVIWDAGYPNVIVSADVLAIPSGLAEQIRTALPEVPRSDLMLLASHTHNGPVLPGVLDPFIAYGITDTSPVDAYGQQWAGAIVALVREALAAPRTPVTLDYQVTVQSWSANRAGLPYAETAVPVLVARDCNRTPVAVLYSYGCHPVAAGIQTQWDGDYPAAASAAIEAAIPGCTALFVPGPAGDQDPSGARGWSLRSSLGTHLGEAVTAAASSPGRPVSGPIATTCTTVALPIDVTITPGNLAAVRDRYAARVAASSTSAWGRRHAQAMIDEIDRGRWLSRNDPHTRLLVPIQTWWLPGDPTLRICAVGGELVSGYAVVARSRCGGPDALMIGGYAAGQHSYLPSDELLPPLRTGGSYEGGWDTDCSGIAGGSMSVYRQLGHYLAGPGGVEDTLTAALTAALT